MHSQAGRAPSDIVVKIGTDRDRRSATGARWQCAHIQQFAGACVTYANGTIDV
ncbi:hypothetical protein [Salinivibrio kushneri]|uniref:hypothetical protein n=1 Tax=Salinivibrio kushneri TaxID=1908198 RepID=UPI0022B54E94|nr:hypothetical protein [Salinivibrio kushneri]WBA17175.1 hypothetical protein O4598_08490 [Salinivibrio kushneri]